MQSLIIGHSKPHKDLTLFTVQQQMHSDSLYAGLHHGKDRGETNNHFGKYCLVRMVQSDVTLAFGQFCVIRFIDLHSFFLFVATPGGVQGFVFIGL